MEYSKSVIESAVRAILKKSADEIEARSTMIIMHGQHLPRGVNFVGSPRVIFSEHVREASFDLTRGRGEPMSINVRVEV